MKNRCLRRVITSVLFLVQTPVVLRAQAQPHQRKPASENQNSTNPDFFSGPPFSLQQIIGLLHVFPARLSQAITKRGIAFEATPENLLRLKNAGLPAEVVNTIRNLAPPRSAQPVVPPSPRHGTLVVKCAPSECDISIDGKQEGATRHGTLEIKGLPLKAVVVDFQKSGYIGQQKKVSISADENAPCVAELEPTNSTKEQFGAELLSMATHSLGGDSGLKDTASLWASGAAVFWNKDGKRTDWTLNALLKLPDMVLFDFQGFNISFWLSLIDDKRKSGGNWKKVGDTSDFDTDLRVFRDFQVAALLDRIKNQAFRLSAVSQGEDDNGEFHLHATGNVEAYEVVLAHDGLPVRVEDESALGLGTKIIYSNYTGASNGKYPLTMVIQLPDSAHHGLEVQFEKVTPRPDLREKDFNGRYKPPK
jgi:hypothetical protein